MRIVTLDWETYWAADYTLSKMTCEEYVRDARFKEHMVGVKVDDKPTTVLTPEQARRVLPQLPWDRLALLAQNTQFDGFILAEHYGTRPKFYLDSMSMFRAFAPHKRASLSVIAQHLQLSKAKGGASGYSVVNTRGKLHLTPEEWRACAAYCAIDCDLAYEAWLLMKPHFPLEELRIIDQNLRFFTEPTLLLNPEPLAAEVEFENEKKEELLQVLGIGSFEEAKKIVGSSQKFAALLETLGAIPPVKPSPAALKKDPELREVLEELDLPQEAYSPALLAEAGIPWTYAFGKTDKGMQALQQHDDPLVVAAVEARLGVKSTLAGTRASRLLSASRRGSYPVAINYAAAHTLRDGGSGGANFQNLPGKKPGQSTRLRSSVIAPPGHLLTVCDLSQIEGRVLAYLAGETEKLKVFRASDLDKSVPDVYCQTAGTVYQRTITKADKDERQIGKVLELSCGYSMSWKKFQENMYLVNRILFDAKMADSLGISVGPILRRNSRYIELAKPQTLTPDQFAVHCAVCEFLVKVYRDKYPGITRFWKTAMESLNWMMEGEELPVDGPGVVYTHHTGFHTAWGRPLNYVDLESSVNKRGRLKWTRASKEGRSHLHPGLVTENIVQWLSRHIVMMQGLKLQSEGLKIAFRCHDELVGVCRAEDAPYWEKRMLQVMSEDVSWLPGLPLFAEAHTGTTYLEAK